MEQRDLFAPMTTAQPKPDVFDVRGAVERLRVLGAWMHAVKIDGVKLSYGVVTHDPWANYAKGGRDLDAFNRKINARKTKPSREEREAEFCRVFVWQSWGVHVGRALVKVAVPSPHCDGSALTREIAVESARGFAMVFGVPAEVVVRYVLTGEVTT
jgi:hypothetical protein